MIYLKLFLTFLEIGAVSFGGGYGMVSLIREQVLSNGWLTEGELLNAIALAESTPGPIAVNIATFIGSKQAGVLGSLCATVGVVLPSFVIILIIAALIRNLLKYRGVEAFLSGVRPCVVALIIATAVTMFLGNVLGISGAGSGASPDWLALGILAVLFAIPPLSGKIFGKKPSPIVMILISAALGIAVYSAAEYFGA